jgi:DNA replication protein DnaC
MNADTSNKLTIMRLTGIKEEYLRQETDRGVEEMSFDERFSQLIDSQYEKREENRKRKLVKMANIRQESADIYDIQYMTDRKLDRKKIIELAQFNWMKTGKTLIITAATGCGKTYISSALGMKACRENKKVMYFKVSELLEILKTKRACDELGKYRLRLKAQDLIILDDFALEKFTPSESRDMLDIIDDRYNYKKSTIIASQLPVSAWPTTFEDKTVRDAFLDRTTNNSIRLPIYGDSMRKVLGENDNQVL